MIYICIPAHNEERTVGPLLWKIRQVMATFPRDYQILVVDDASTDATGEVLEPYTRVLPLTVIRHDRRLGYAASLEELVREAVRRAAYPKRDVVVTLQADFTDQPDEIPTLVKQVEGGADLVTGAVQLDGESVPRGVRWVHRARGFLLRRFQWPEPVTDPVSGFRAYRVVCLKRALEACDGRPLLTWDGWAANAELLQAVGPYCRRVAEADVAVRYDRRARPTRFRLWTTAQQLFRFARRPNGGAAPGRGPAPDEPDTEPADGAEDDNAAGRRAPAGRGRGSRGRRGRGSRGGRGGQRRRGGGDRDGRSGAQPDSHQVNTTSKGTS